MRMEISSLDVSSRNRWFGNRGVRLSKRILSLTSSGFSKLTASTLRRAKYRSPSLGGRTCPDTVSPVRRSKRRICEGET